MNSNTASGIRISKQMLESVMQKRHGQDANDTGQGLWLQTIILDQIPFSQRQWHIDQEDEPNESNEGKNADPDFVVFPIS